MSDWKNVQYKDGKMRTSESGGGGGSSTFAGLDDVKFQNLQNGQVPKYNSTTQKWENANESGGGTVTDVTLDGTSVVNGQGVAELETPSADDIEYNNQQSGLSATDVQSAIDELAQGGSGASALANLTDVNLTNIQDGQIIKWDATNSKWVNANESSGGSGHTYSTTEQRIGTWIDGKTMYEITIPFNTTASMYQSIDISGLNIDTPLFAELTAHCQLNGTDWITGGYFQDNYDGLNCYVTSNKQTLIIRSKQNYPRGIGYCVLTYTKSSS